MGSTRDFLTATFADALAPSFKRPVEDIIYETLDRRQTPSRTDFKEVRDSLNSLSSQNSGFGNGIKRLKEGLDDLEESVHDLETQLVDLDNSYKTQQADNAKLKDTLNVLMEKVLLLESKQSKSDVVSSVKTETPAKKTSSKVNKICKIDGCDGSQRASGFCGPHYGRWRRGTLEGFIDYEGKITLNDKEFLVGKKYRGQEFFIKDSQVLIDNASVLTLK